MLLLGFFGTNFLMTSWVVSVPALTVPKATSVLSDPIYLSGLADRMFFDTAYDKATTDLFRAPRDARAIVSPHHLLVADRIAALFSSVASRRVKTVVVLSPNHFSRGRTPIILSEGTWDTPYGSVRSDAVVARELAESFSDTSSRAISIDETPFSEEHGVAALTPFIARSFSNADIVPILFDETAIGYGEVSDVMQKLAALRPDAFLVASVDFSHYLPSAPQRFHDDVSVACLKRGLDCQPLSGSIDLEVDSNATLGALKVWNAVMGMERFTQAFHSSSLDLIPSGRAEENTSHVGGWFSAGEAFAEPFASFQMTGDIMLDRGVRLKMNEYGVSYPWESVERFLRGTHFVVGNLEGTVNKRPSRFTYDPPFQFVFDPFAVEEMRTWINLVSLANNHVRDVGIVGEEETREWLDDLGVGWFGSFADPSRTRIVGAGGLRIAFVGYNAFVSNEDALAKAIAQARDEADFTVVMPHWGTEYQSLHSSEERRLAEKMVFAGADLIVGSHPHVVQDMEVIEGVPVVYSLGNFVFDQPMTETWTGMSLGVTIDPQFVTLYLLPVSTKEGQPIPLSDTAAEKIFSTLPANAPSAYDVPTRGILRASRIVR